MLESRDEARAMGSPVLPREDASNDGLSYAPSPSTLAFDAAGAQWEQDRRTEAAAREALFNIPHVTAGRASAYASSPLAKVTPVDVTGTVCVPVCVSLCVR